MMGSTTYYLAPPKPRIVVSTTTGLAPGGQARRKRSQHRGLIAAQFKSFSTHGLGLRPLHAAEPSDHVHTSVNLETGEVPSEFPATRCALCRTNGQDSTKVRIHLLYRRNHKFRHFLQRGHEHLVTDSSQNSDPFRTFPNIPGYPHLHLPPRVCIVEPFGKSTEAPFYRVQSPIAQLYCIPVEPAVQVQCNLPELSRRDVGKESFDKGGYRDFQQFEGSTWQKIQWSKFLGEGC